jgi:hypothetical protein
LPEESFTIAASETGKKPLTGVCCGVVPAPGETEAGVPDVFVSAKIAGTGTPVTFAESLYEPATLFAVKSAAVAMPLEFVSAVFTPPANVPEGPVEGAVNVTSTPEPTVLPEESRTVAWSLTANVFPMRAFCPEPAVALTLDGEPGFTVIFPDAAAFSPAESALICAVPMTCPVNVALLAPGAGTRSPPTTPPDTDWSDQLAATFLTKLPAISRAIANTVILDPEVIVLSGGTTPVPFADVSTLIFVGGPAFATFRTPEGTEMSEPVAALICAVPRPAPVNVALRPFPAATRSPGATPPVRFISDQAATVSEIKLLN